MASHPYISLPKALDMAWTIYQNEKTNPAKREVLVTVIGYGTLNGSSDAALTAMVNYGLLEELRDRQLKVSNAALEIFESNPGDPKRLQAIQDAVSRIEAFEELRSQFGDRMVSENTLVEYFQSRGLSYRIAVRTAKVYRATTDFINREQHPDLQNARKFGGDDAEHGIRPRAPSAENEFDHWTLTFALDEGMEVQVIFKARRADEYEGRLTSERIGTLIDYLTLTQKSFEKNSQKRDDG